MTTTIDNESRTSVLRTYKNKITLDHQGADGHKRLFEVANDGTVKGTSFNLVDTDGDLVGPISASELIMETTDNADLKGFTHHGALSTETNVNLGRFFMTRVGEMRFVTFISDSGAAVGTSTYLSSTDPVITETSDLPRYDVYFTCHTLDGTTQALSVGFLDHATGIIDIGANSADPHAGFTLAGAVGILSGFTFMYKARSDVDLS